MPNPYTPRPTAKTPAQKALALLLVLCLCAGLFCALALALPVRARALPANTLKITHPDGTATYTISSSNVNHISGPAPPQVAVHASGGTAFIVTSAGANAGGAWTKLEASVHVSLTLSARDLEISTIDASNGLTVEGGTLTTSSLTATGGIFLHTTTLQPQGPLYSNITCTGDATINGLLTGFNGGLTINPNVTLTLPVADNVFTSLNCSSFTGTGTLRKTGGGTLVVQGNPVPGFPQVEVAEGWLTLNTNAAAIGSAMTVAPGATLSLAGSSSCFFTGDIAVGAGATLNLGKNNTITGSLTGTGTLLGTSIGTTIGGNLTKNFAGSMQLDSGSVVTLDTADVGSLIVQGQLSGSGTLQLINSADFVLGGDASSFTGEIQALSGGTVLFSPAGHQTFNGTITGTGRVKKSGTGTLTLTQPSTYTGSTTVEMGTLVAGDASALGSGPLVMDAGAHLQLAPGVHLAVMRVDQTAGASTYTFGAGSMLIANIGDLALSPGTTIVLNGFAPGEHTLFLAEDYPTHMVKGTGAAMAYDQFGITVNGAVLQSIQALDDSPSVLPPTDAGALQIVVNLGPLPLAPTPSPPQATAATGSTPAVTGPSPQTGDAAAPAPWLLLGVLAAAGLAACIAATRRVVRRTDK